MVNGSGVAGNNTSTSQSQTSISPINIDATGQDSNLTTGSGCLRLCSATVSLGCPRSLTAVANSRFMAHRERLELSAAGLTDQFLHPVELRCKEWCCPAESNC